MKSWKDTEKPHVGIVKKVNLKRLQPVWHSRKDKTTERLKRLKRSMVSSGKWEGMMNRLNTEGF